MRIEASYLPEFGLAVNWAMCRNPMCEQFGIGFEGELSAGRKQVSDKQYAVRRATDPLGVCRI